jgi:uncharacterized protein (DUF58 family)
MPTRLGITVSTAGSVLVAAGGLLGYRAVTTVGCAAILIQLLALASIAWRPRLALARELSSPRVTRGEPAVCALTVTRRSRWPAPPVTVIDAFGGRELEVTVPRRATTVTYRLDTTRRGVFPVGPLQLCHTDAFGLAALTRSATGTATLRVHPRVHPFAVVPSGRARHLDGPLADTALARSITFHRLREYTPGDDLRHVHWKSTARTGNLMVREYIDTSLPGTTVLLDAAAAAFPAPQFFEEAVEVAASALAAAVRGGFPARLAAAGALTEGRVSVTAFLDRLAELAYGAGGGLAAAAGLLPGTRAGGILLAVTGAVRPAEVALIRRLAPAFDRTLLVALTGKDAPASDGTVTVLAAPGAAAACLACGQALTGKAR